MSFTALAVLVLALSAQAANVLPSWNGGPTKQAIVDFVRATTDQSSPKFVPPEERIATFDQDGTLWVSHPMYAQVRYCFERLHGIPPEQVIGTAGATKYGYGKDGKPFLTKEPKLLLNDDNAGKPEGIHLMIGRRPYMAVGNSTGDRARLTMLVLHDDAKREYAYGPAQGLPDTKVGIFPQALYDEGKKQGWVVISVKNDWKCIFAFEWRSWSNTSTGRFGSKTVNKWCPESFSSPTRLLRELRSSRRSCMDSTAGVGVGSG